MTLSRRSVLRGLIAAPAVILTPKLLMPVKSVPLVDGYQRWFTLDISCGDETVLAYLDTVTRKIHPVMLAS